MCETMILAAGYASRVGLSKMAMPYKESMFFKTTIRRLIPYYNQLLVVIGHYHDVRESINKPKKYPKKLTITNHYLTKLYVLIRGMT